MWAWNQVLNCIFPSWRVKTSFNFSHSDLHLWLCNAYKQNIECVLYISILKWDSNAQKHFCRKCMLFWSILYLKWWRYNLVYVETQNERLTDCFTVFFMQRNTVLSIVQELINPGMVRLQKEIKPLKFIFTPNEQRVDTPATVFNACCTKMLFMSLVFDNTENVQ